MNVMALAHKITRETIAACAPTVLSYRNLFAAALSDYHRKYKAMQKEQALMLLKAEETAKFEARIVELKAYLETPNANKWVVTCGGLPVDFEAPNKSWPWAKVENASQWNSPQFARVNAEKVRNGNGEFGTAVNIGDYCKAEIEKLTGLINSIV